MSFRYPIPNEQQAEALRKNGMAPDAYFVKYADENGRMYLQCYKTGDEIVVTPNPLKGRM